MSFKPCFWNVLDILVFLHPLILSSCFQVLRNLELFNCVNEGVFNQDDIDVLEMDFVGLALVSLDFIGL
jgi:hypothetical protein